ncbi:hypothetical protein KC360_g6172 [Hortaea werneckii]|nr:hypothetical protein KC325_g6120 [Hortaea werneckii]KAI6990564.1 hypothetical protein KC359_g6636 [Hortaea werneckii]KAI7086995.1 hypothetical protein KC356_g4554 [Hortaea werneckii]KAI7143727.1 hypothetical protein KC344_g6039 [Hortaea werneckii]KAI7171397.1 hypothetical protein KC360_g6172 [Hortaea werneckii]
MLPSCPDAAPREAALSQTSSCDMDAFRPAAVDAWILFIHQGLINNYVASLADLKHDHICSSDCYYARDQDYELVSSLSNNNVAPAPSAPEDEKRVIDPHVKMPKDQRKYSDPSSLAGSTGNRGSVSPVASKSKPVIHQQPNDKVYEPGQKGYAREDKWR